jgi:hypothetical protein
MPRPRTIFSVSICFAVVTASVGACSGGGLVADESPDASDSDASSPPSGDAAQATDTGTPVEASAPAVCGPETKNGNYCGNDKMVDGDPDVLYTCAGPGAPTKAAKCDVGCAIVQGQDDVCKLQATPDSYRLPWSAGTTMRLTQDCDDACCSDHVGSDKYAWDWANGGTFLVRAARAGTITHMKINSTKGCATTACSTDVNMIVVDHGDGSQAIYMHLAGNTAQAGLTCGAKVVQGQPLAMAGTTGHSTGIHLHFQVSQVHASAPTCECGSDGKQCATTFNPFPNVWVNTPYHTLPASFEEWPTASTCSNRRITMPAALSQ